MHPIAETRTYQIGKFTIREQPRYDNPAWPKYLIFLGDKLIGSQFSRPGVSDCEWQARGHIYALPSQSQPQRVYSAATGIAGRLKNAERAKRAA